MNIGSLTFLLGANTAGLTRAAGNMRHFESQVLGSNGRMQSSFAALGSQMMLTGTMMTQYLTVPIGLLATAGVVAFAKYETQMAKIVALTGTTQAQANSWSHSILSMSKEFGQAPKDVAAAMYFIASPALKASTAMDVLKASSMGAAIGLGETQVIGKSLVNVINAYGESNITASHALDVMVTAIKNGVVEASDFASALGKVLPTAQSLGVEFEDLAGSLTALTLTGKTASEASTQLNRLFTTLIQSPKRAEKVLESFGISFAELRKTLRDEGMMKTIQTLSKMIGGDTLDVAQNTKAFEDNIDVLGDVFTNLRALLPVLDALGPNMQNWTKILDDMTKSTGAAKTAWDVISGTVAKRFEIAVSNMKVALIGFGETIKEPVIGLLQSVARHIENISNWFQSLSSSTQANIVWWAGLLAIMGPVLLILGSLVGGIRMVGGAISWLGTIMLAHPWVRFTTAAILLVGVIANVINNVNKLNVVQQALNDVNTQALQNTVAQKQELESLLRLATNQNASLKTREEAVKRINAIIPEYLGSITQETLRTGEATEAIRKHITMLGLQAKAEAVKANMVETERKRISDLASGSDKQLSFFDKTAAFTNTAIASFYGKFNKKTLDKFWTEQETVNAAGSRKVYNQLMDFYLKLETDLQLQVEGMKVAPVPVMLQGVAKVNADAEMAKLKLEEAAKASAEFWKAYAGKDVAGKISDLNTLMQTANGKELDGLAKKWVVLDKIKTKQDELIDQAKKVVYNLPMTMKGIPNKSIIDRSGLKKEQAPIWGEGADPTGNMKSQFTDLVKISADLQRSLALIGIQETYLGGSFDRASAEVEVQSNLLDSYMDQIVKTTKNSAFWIYLNQQIKDTLGNLGTAEATATVEWYNKTLADAEWNTKTFGKSSETLSNRLNIEQQHLEKLRNARKQDNIEIQKSIDLIKQLKGTQTALDFIQVIGQGSVELLGTYGEILDQNKQKELAWVDKIAKAQNKSAQWVAKQQERIDNEYGKRMKKIAITQAIINGALAITSVWAHSKNWIVSLAESAFVVANTALQISKIQSAGMAQGGTVPSGFPNDSFPAMLTSGETVVPAFDSARMFGKGVNQGQQQVVFEIEGRKLVGVLQNMGKLQHSY